MMPQITQEVIGHDAPLVHRGCPPLLALRIIR
jgi:hypothetical protein